MTSVARVFQHTGQRACLLPGEQESPSSTSQTRLSILFDNAQSRAMQLGTRNGNRLLYDKYGVKLRTASRAPDTALPPACENRSLPFYSLCVSVVLPYWMSR